MEQSRAEARVPLCSTQETLNLTSFVERRRRKELLYALMLMLRCCCWEGGRRTKVVFSSKRKRGVNTLHSILKVVLNAVTHEKK
jgi:hypothetical protein